MTDLPDGTVVKKLSRSEETYGLIGLSLPLIRATMPSALLGQHLSAADRHGRKWTFPKYCPPASSGFSFGASQFVREHRLVAGDVVALSTAQVRDASRKGAAVGVCSKALPPPSSYCNCSLMQPLPHSQGGGLLIDYNTPQVLAAWEAQQQRADMSVQAAPQQQAQLPQVQQQGVAIVAKNMTRR